MEVLFKKQFEIFRTNFHQEYNDIPVKKKIVNVSEDRLFGDVLVWDAENYVWDAENSAISSATEKHPYFKYLRSEDTKESFEKNYGNPLTTVELHRLTLVVEKNEDKVSMKLFSFSKQRIHGKSYFKKDSSLWFITYKFKTNELYSGKLINGFKKRKYSSRVRKNYFAQKPFEVIRMLFHNHYSMYKKNFNLDDNIDKDITTNAINLFLKEIPNLTLNDDLTYDELMFKNYLDLKGVKYPNNFKLYMSKIPLPTKRVLKKTNNKLVDSFMLNKGLNGDKIKRVLHSSKEFINEEFYKQAENLFGEKFLRHQSEEDLRSIFEFKSGYQIPGDITTFSDVEKKNAFLIFKKSVKDYSGLQTFIDHINFYLKLKQFEEIKWKSNDMKSFHNEHMDWTERYSHYTRGRYTRHYFKPFMDKVQQSIDSVNYGVYYPVVLTTSLEYIRESSLQSNCVKTYVNKASSLIISLREGDVDSEERATIEYQIHKVGNDVKMSRVQSLGRFNQALDFKWYGVLEELDNRINSALKDVGFELPKVVVEFGKQSVESETKFIKNSSNDKSYLNWVSPFLSDVLPEY
jgi:hypothetical protein